MDALAALRLQIEWGADEALEEAPVDRLAAQPAPPPPTLAPPTLTPPPPPPPPTRRIVALPTQRAAGSALVAQAEQAAAAATSLEALRAALEAFHGCPLHVTATNLVFADGNPDAGLMLVGEFPGAEEDRAGLPFVGASGQFLDRMLASINLDRTRLVITNLIPWRPPGSRNPTDNEVLTCLPFLLRHIALVRPRHLVLLGAMAAKAITGNPAGIRRLRGKFLSLPIPGLAEPIPTLPMLHPAYLLRNPRLKREAWADWLTLRRALDAAHAVVTENPPPSA